MYSKSTIRLEGVGNYTLVFDDKFVRLSKAKRPKCRDILKNNRYRTLSENLMVAVGRKDPMDGKNSVIEIIRSQAPLYRYDFRHEEKVQRLDGGWWKMIA